MENLAKAILQVMEEVKGIEKSMKVGSGNYAYNGVPDQEVKKIIGESMRKNGLILLPIAIEPKVQIDRWEEVFNGQAKTKQSVFTEVLTTYKLIHVSGESMEIKGYGHGVDNSDKSAGKATTYALKYALLYTFLVPTGKIDDADNMHSNENAVPKIVQKAKLDEKRFEKAVSKIIEGSYSVKSLIEQFDLNKEQMEVIEKIGSDVKKA
jgi:hypothetical protein